MMLDPSCAEVVDELLEQVLHHGTEQPQLAPEVVVDGSLRDPGFPGDVIERCHRVSGVGEEALGRLDHRSPGVRRVLGPPPHVDHTRSIRHTLGMKDDGPVDRHVVISADGHVFGPGNGLLDTSHMEVLTDYFEARYQAAYGEYMRQLAVDMSERTQRFIGALFDEHASPADGTRGLYDSQHRLRDLAGEGIVAEVLFPNGLPFGPGFAGREHAPELRSAGARAYNRWLADFCRQAPGRRAGMAVVTLHDIDAAVDEVRRAKDDGLKGVLLPNYWGTERIAPYLDIRYEPFWSACADTGMPLNVHGGASIGDIDMATYGVPAMLTYATETTFLSTRPLNQLIWGGVFERHPDLTLVLTESRADWVPSRLAFLDGVYEDQLFAHVKHTVKHKPSEYWHRQCYVAASFMSRDEALLRHRIGLDRLLWGADYPHYEGTWPHTDRWLEETFGGLPAPDAHAILAENAGSGVRGSISTTWLPTRPPLAPPSPTSRATGRPASCGAGRGEIEGSGDAGRWRVGGARAGGLEHGELAGEGLEPGPGGDVLVLGEEDRLGCAGGAAQQLEQGRLQVRRPAR